MLLLATLIMLILAALNFRLGRRLFYPPVVFCLVWAFDLVLIALAGDFFFPLSEKTLAIITFACLAFSMGSALAFFMPSRQTRVPYILKASNKILNWLLVATVIGLPIFYHWVVELTGGTGITDVVAVRAAMVALGNGGEIESSLYENIATFTLAIATVACLEDGRKRKVLALLVGVFITLLSGSRYAIATLMLSAFFLDWLRQGKLRWRLIIPGVAAFVIFFGIMAVYLGHGETSTKESLADNTVPVIQLVGLYASGPLVAYDRVVREPGIIPHSWQVDRALLLALNKFGFHFKVPTIFAEYVAVGKSDIEQNAYTMYFAYYDWGIGGTLLLTAMVGFSSTWLFRRSLVGHRIAAVLCAYFIAECILGVFNENFFLGLNYIVKLAAVLWVVYSLPVMWRKFLRFCSEVVASSPPPGSAVPSRF
jgi:hypothetical protein